ncbi:MAG: PRC-barrel domain-containing protein [Candidatus Nitrosopumilus sp. bin_68KS]
MSLKITESNPQLTKNCYLEDFIGKTVIDSNGQNCGKIKSIIIDSRKFSVSGILVKKRLAKEYFLSQDYFEEFNESGLSLNTIPIKPGDKVADIDGKNIGRVIQINLNSETNKLESLVIKSKFKSVIVTSERIIAVGDKIKIKLF